MKLAPDGKIYVVHSSDDGDLTVADSLGVIHNPDAAGQTCDFRPRSFPLIPGRARIGLPNIPNYRLGPLSAQPADAGPDQEYCLNGTPIQIGTPDTSGGIVTFRWFTIAGAPASASLSDTTIAQPLASPSDTTTYILETIDMTLGPDCGTTTDTVTIFPVRSEPLPAGEDQTLCRELESAEIGSDPGGKYICRWECDRGREALLQTLDPVDACMTVATPYATTTYMLYSTDTTIGAGCPELVDEVTLTVEVCDLEVPNVVTPNGDQVNDVFFITHLPEGTKVSVFDRWGSEIYSSQNYGNDWVPGPSVPEGVYYYVVMPEKGLRMAGSLTILR